jgi:hypothetical protein
MGRVLNRIIDWWYDVVATRRGRAIVWSFGVALGGWMTFAWLVQGEDFSDEPRIVHPIEGPILVLLGLYFLWRTLRGKDDRPS